MAALEAAVSIARSNGRLRSPPFRQEFERFVTSAEAVSLAASTCRTDASGFMAVGQKLKSCDPD
jgi:hypothetical protein